MKGGKVEGCNDEGKGGCGRRVEGELWHLGHLGIGFSCLLQICVKSFYSGYLFEILRSAHACKANTKHKHTPYTHTHLLLYFSDELLKPRALRLVLPLQLCKLMDTVLWKEDKVEYYGIRRTSSQYSSPPFPSATSSLLFSVNSLPFYLLLP